MNFLTMSAEELQKIKNDEKYLIVDVRDAAEYAKKHVPGAVNIPLGRLGQTPLDRGKIIVLYCEHGGNSMVAARELSRRGFQVRTVVGGMKAYLALYND